VTNKNKELMGRRSVLTGMGVAAAGVVTGAATANAQGVFQPARHDNDKWMDEIPGKHRAWIDTSYGVGGMEALHYANNILSSNVNAYGGADSDYAMVICWRHYATPYAFGDAVWSKYGEVFSDVMKLADPQTGKAWRVNPANIAGRTDLDNGGDTIDKTLARGVQVAICNAATQFYAAGIAGAVKGDTATIYKELVDAAVPNSRLVPAGVIATTRAQEYGYSLLYAG